MANQLKIELTQISDSASEAAARTHRLVVDRPSSKGGTDLGPMGGELFLAAVGGCFMSNLLAAIKARGADVTGVRIETTGILLDSPARFSAIEVHVYADGGSRDLLERLVEIADRGCIMMNTLRGKLDVQVRVAVPA